MSQNKYKCDILGVSFDINTKETARMQTVKFLSQRKNARIFTPNAEILYKASRQPSLCRLLNSADLCLPDGIGVIAASRILSKPLPRRITGIDTAEWVLEYAAAHGLSVFLLGGKPNVAERAKQKLIKRFSGLDICGTHHGYFDTEGKENQAVLYKIKKARPDILFVCLGFPRQEKWIVSNTPSLPFLRLSMGIGGSLDVWSGDVKRTPKPIQKIGLEWLWRAAAEPSRLHRLPALGAFAVRVMATKHQKRPFKA